MRWGLIPYWCTDPAGGRKPINAKCETVRNLPTFRDAYRKRRCIVPVDGFFEWKAIKGQRAKQPYAIAMRDGAPFGLAGCRTNGTSRTYRDVCYVVAIGAPGGRLRPVGSPRSGFPDLLPYRADNHLPGGVVCLVRAFSNGPRRPKQGSVG